MRIKDYIKQAKTITNTPFCGEISESDLPLYPECIVDATFQAVLANYIKDSNGKLELNDDIIEEFEDITDADIEDLIDIIQDVCQTWYIANKYRYENLYQTMLFEYNPIENYNMVETEAGSHNESGSGSTTIGAQSNTHTIGAQSNSHTIGQQTDGMAYGATQKTNNYAQVQLTDVVGAQENSVSYTQQQNTKQVGQVQLTDVIGQQQNTNAYGQQHKTVDDGDKKHTEIEVNTHGVSAYNQTNNLSGAGQNSTDGWGTGSDGYSNFSNESRDVREHTNIDATTKALSETDDAHTDTLTLGTHTDTHTTAQHTDTDTLGAHTDTTNLGTHTDTHTTGSREDTEATIAHTDTRTLSARSDSDSIGQRQDSDSLGSRSDSRSDSSHGSNNRRLTRSGNIGVTTTQMMIESQRDVANFNFMKLVCKDIVKKIASLIYD